MSEVENTLRLGVDSTDFKRGTQEVEAAVNKVNQGVDKLTDTAEEAKRTLTGLKDVFASTSAGAGTAATTFTQATAAIKPMGEALDKASSSAKKNTEETKKNNEEQKKQPKTLNEVRSALVGLARDYIPVIGVMEVFRRSLAEASNAQVGQLRLNALLKAQGDQALMTSGQVNRLASELQRMTAFDDDSIVNATTNLLRFGNMTTDTVERATRLAAGLASASDRFGDVGQAAQILGRALQNPGEGMRALQIAGFGLTNAQEKVLKGFVDANEPMKAQDYLLSQLEGKIGDVAAAYKDTMAGALKSAANSIGNFFEAIGNTPYFTKSITELGKSLEDAFDVEKHQGAAAIAAGIGNAFAFVVDTLGKAVIVVSFLLDKMTGFVFDTGTKIGEVWHYTGERTKIEFTAAYDYIVELFSKLPEVIGRVGLNFGNKARTLYEYMKGGTEGAAAYQQTLTQEERNMLNGTSSGANVGADAMNKRQQALDSLNSQMSAYYRYKDVQEAATTSTEKLTETTDKHVTTLNTAGNAVSDLMQKYLDAAKGLNQQISETEKLTASYDDGAIAVAKATKEQAIMTQVRQIDEKFTVAQKAAIEALIRKLAEENDALANRKALYEGQKTLDRMGKEYQLVTATSEQRELELALYDKRIELQERGVDLQSKQAQLELQQTEQIVATGQALKKAQTEQEEFLGIFTSGIKNIQGGFEDMFTKIASGGKVTLGSFIDDMKSMFAQAAAKIANMLIFQPILASAVNAISPSLASAAGLGNPVGSSSAGGGMSSISNVVGLGKSAYSFLTGGSAALDAFGASAFGMAPGASFVGPLMPGTTATGTSSLLGGTTLSSVLGPAGIGFGVGSLLGGLGANKVVSSIGGTASGALAGFMMGGPVGAVIGGIAGIAGGLLGGKAKPSNAWATANVDFTKGKGTYTHPNKGNSAENMKIMQTNMDAVIQFIQGFNELGAGTATGSAVGELGTRDTGYVTVTGQNGSKRISVPKGDYAGFAKSTAAAVLDLTTITNSDVKKAVGKTDFGDLNAALADLQFAAGFQDALKAYRGELTIETSVKKSATEAASALVTQITGFNDAAERLGLSVTDAKSATKKYVDNLIAGTDAKTYTDVENAVMSLRAQWDAMVPVLEAVGYTAAQAAQQIQNGYTNNLKKLTDSFNKSITDQILQINDPVAYAMRQLDAEFETMRKNAIAVGGDMAKIEELYGLKRAAILAQSNQDTINAMKQAGTQLRSWLDNQLLSNTSTLSPVEKLLQAQSQFGTTISAARGGDTTALGNVTNVADSLLNVAKDYYASSPEYAALVSMVRSQVESLGGSLGLDGFSTASTAAQATVSQLQAFRTESREDADALKAEISAMRLSLEELNNKLLAITSISGGRAA